MNESPRGFRRLGWMSNGAGEPAWTPGYCSSASHSAGGTGYGCSLLTQLQSMSRRTPRQIDSRPIAIVVRREDPRTAKSTEQPTGTCRTETAVGPPSIGSPRRVRLCNRQVPAPVLPATKSSESFVMNIANNIGRPRVVIGADSSNSTHGWDVRSSLNGVFSAFSTDFYFRCSIGGTEPAEMR
jgi:hypothetical protein